ncbi:hypothetical protein [Nitrospira sp. M1]
MTNDEYEPIQRWTAKLRVTLGTSIPLQDVTRSLNQLLDALV